MLSLLVYVYMGNHMTYDISFVFSSRMTISPPPKKKPLHLRTAFTNGSGNPSNLSSALPHRFYKPTGPVSVCNESANASEDEGGSQHGAKGLAGGNVEVPSVTQTDGREKGPRFRAEAPLRRAGHPHGRGDQPEAAHKGPLGHGPAGRLPHGAKVHASRRVPGVLPEAVPHVRCYQTRQQGPPGVRVQTPHQVCAWALRGCRGGRCRGFS